MQNCEFVASVRYRGPGDLANAKRMGRFTLIESAISMATAPDADIRHNTCGALKTAAALLNHFSSGIDNVVQRMKVDVNRNTRAMSPRPQCPQVRPAGQPVGGFTLIEVMISLALLLILIVSSFSAIFTF